MKPQQQKNGVHVPNQKTAQPIKAVATPVATAPVVAAKESPATLQMPEGLLAEVHKLNEEQQTKKMQYADQALAMASAQREMLELETNIRTTGDAIMTSVMSFAKAHGIDISDTAQGKWNFELASGVLTKVI